MSSFHSTMPNSDHNKTFPPLMDTQTNQPELTKQRYGRRKTKITTEKPKKQPQRGVGVAQLERLRLREKLNEINTFQPYPFVSSSSSSSFAQPTMINNGGFRVSNGDFHIGFNQWFHGQNGNIKCVSDHCSSCHKKKRVDGENFACFGSNYINGSSRFVSFNVGNNLGDQDFATKHGYVVGNTDQRVDNVAAHKKSGGVFEYEFFPEKKDIKSFPSSSSSASYQLMKFMGGTESSVVVAEGRNGSEAYCVSTTTTIESATSIDLSLKL